MGPTVELGVGGSRLPQAATRTAGHCHGCTGGVPDAFRLLACAPTEDTLGFEFLPELKELLAWRTAQNPCAPSFFPSLVFESLLSPARMVQETQRSQQYMWRDLYEHADNALGSNTDFVIVAAEGGVIAIDHHRPGPTCGGIWHVDIGIARWAAKDLPSLVRSCIGMANHGC